MWGTPICSSSQSHSEDGSVLEVVVGSSIQVVHTSRDGRVRYHCKVSETYRHFFLPPSLPSFFPSTCLGRFARQSEDVWEKKRKGWNWCCHFGNVEEEKRREWRMGNSEHALPFFFFFFFSPLPASSFSCPTCDQDRSRRLEDPANGVERYFFFLFGQEESGTMGGGGRGILRVMSNHPGIFTVCQTVAVVAGLTPPSSLVCPQRLHPPPLFFFSFLEDVKRNALLLCKVRVVATGLKGRRGTRRDS